MLYIAGPCWFNFPKLGGFMLKILSLILVVFTSLQASAVSIVTPQLQQYPLSVQIDPDYETQIMDSNLTMYTINGSQKLVMAPWFKKKISLENNSDEPIILSALEFTVQGDNGFSSTDTLPLTQQITANGYLDLQYYFTLTDVPKPFSGSGKFTITGTGTTTGLPYTRSVEFALSL